MFGNGKLPLNRRMVRFHRRRRGDFQKVVRKSRNRRSLIYSDCEASQSPECGSQYVPVMMCSGIRG